MGKIKRLLAAALSATMFAASFSLNSTYVSAATPELTACSGWYESMYAQWDNDSDGANATVYYKASDSNTYTEVDEELVRSTDTGGRVDIVGISAGTYDIKIVTSNGATITKSNIDVEAYDRSGYAHFNYTNGVGAYNDDGTPKDNADIIYVTNDTKNTVEFNGVTGIGNILAECTNDKSFFSNPTIIRIIGTVDTCLWDDDKTQKTDLANGRVVLEGLTSTFDTDDTYLNMADVRYVTNLTVEGIGDDAIIDRWGFTFTHCSYIEIRNITFQNYPEDACAYQGGSNTSMSDTHNYWLHHCTFNKGLNWCDLTSEKDKGDGDGSTDIKYCTYVTFAYNKFNDCHKTSLHGGSDAAYQYHITWHHNYFNECTSRLPLVRQANVHLYNNYYYGTTSTCIDARASAWVFSECNYFEDSTNPYKYTSNSSYGNPVIKIYGDVRSNSTYTSSDYINIATDRTATYSFSDNNNTYQNFDTDSTNFYYDDTNKCSDVTYITDAATAKTDCVANSGVLVTEELDSTENVTVTILGDVNNSGSLDKIDAAVILRYCAAGTWNDTYNFDVADANSDGNVDILDSIYILSNISSESEDETESTTEAATESTTYVLDLTSGLTVDTDYNGISVLENMSYANSSATINGTAYTGCVTGTNNPTLTDGIPTAGAVMVITPSSDCTFKIAYKLNKDKTFYVLNSSGETVYSYENSTSDNAYYEATVSLTANTTYYAYVGGSKVPIYYVSLY